MEPGQNDVAGHGDGGPPSWLSVGSDGVSRVNDGTGTIGGGRPQTTREKRRLGFFVGKEKVDDGDCSWLELLNSVEASTSSESKKL
ncbi:hypothetical protein Godav_000555 [Gossypium davidsonii]|uniref:Uncharacterized protein n=1 Tax=Gossypium davidsonii TaxID=34287 RepID=A0A7J8T1R4_GOSDV|nr:hypothetical protein [Gossypium davidsonii]